MIDKGEEAAARDNVYGAGLDYYKGYVKRVLGRAKTDESFAKYNKENVFWAGEAAGLVSIAEFGNEEVKHDARYLLELAFYAGRGRHGKTKARNNHAIAKLITKVWSHD
jgi:hypothetical protein